ncbi:ricin-type beta-trefoil lectin domain protein [Streptomyces sp. NPDC058657]|uniref:RICIN domain-containing protein n=1 Tax=unclassified Streptomyces TaxID=2593676 RepID=UPI003665376A
MSVIGAAVGLAVSLTLAMPGAATAAETAAIGLDRFANYEHKQCIEESVYDQFIVTAQTCDRTNSQQYWYWNGNTNTSSALQNSVWDHCLDSNSQRHVYMSTCSGNNNQLWQIIQPAPASAVMLRNTATRLCLYQTHGGLYATETCDRNDRDQRWTIG